MKLISLSTVHVWVTRILLYCFHEVQTFSWMLNLLHYKDPICTSMATEHAVMFYWLWEVVIKPGSCYKIKTQITLGILTWKRAPNLSALEPSNVSFLCLWSRSSWSWATGKHSILRECKWKTEGRLEWEESINPAQACRIRSSKSF